MSDTVLIALVGAVQVIVLALIQRDRVKNRREDKADRADVARKVDGTQNMLSEIHEITNSNYQLMVKKLEEANEKIEQLLLAAKPQQEK